MQLHVRRLFRGHCYVNEEHTAAVTTLYPVVLAAVLLYSATVPQTDVLCLVYLHYAYNAFVVSIFLVDDVMIMYIYTFFINIAYACCYICHMMLYCVLVERIRQVRTGALGLVSTTCIVYTGSMV